MNYTITFKKNGYEPFIDFLKAFAIVSVVVGHLLPSAINFYICNFFGNQAVPIFLLIQTFHSYKKDNTYFNIGKFFKRVFLPFLITEILLFIGLLMKGADPFSLALRFLRGGGVGPGSYYPWIYLQIAILLPLVKPIFNKFSKRTLLILFLLLSESLEILCSTINLPDKVYRLLAFRYVFLIYLGWLWVKDGVIINSKTILLSILSLIAIVYFGYFAGDIEPFFFNTAWRCQRWPCYFVMANMWIGILYWIWNWCKKSNEVQKIVKTLANSSWEIFLAQMLFIGLITSETFDFIGNAYLSLLARMIAIFVVSLIVGISVRKLIDRSKQNRIK